jgi:hypothetical protein
MAQAKRTSYHNIECRSRAYWRANRQAAVLLPSSFGRRVVVRITVTHQDRGFYFLVSVFVSHFW